MNIRESVNIYQEQAHCSSMFVLLYRLLTYNSVQVFASAVNDI